MISASTIKLLRIPFSFFLSPIYFFSLAQVPNINWSNACLIFFILHFLIYPASNGYNSYMDRDTESIGGLEKPPAPSPELFRVTIILDCAGILLSLLIGPLFTAVMLLYIGASKAYSYRGIRLKKFPYLGYLIVIVFQGAVTFWLVYYGCNMEQNIQVPWQGLVICSLLVGGFYPLTQIYQHKQDINDGVSTISYKLGYSWHNFLFNSGRGNNY
jgi:1,4-dihydroxy-2-naphthoate octaprenyltransferase